MSQVAAERIAEDAYVVALAAGVDVQQELDRALEAALAGGGRRLVVDASGIPYLDTPTLDSLLAVRARLHAAGGALALVVDEWTLRHALELTRLDEQFSLHETRGGALAALAD